MTQNETIRSMDLKIKSDTNASIQMCPFAGFKCILFNSDCMFGVGKWDIPAQTLHLFSQLEALNTRLLATTSSHFDLEICTKVGIFHQFDVMHQKVRK